MGTRKLPCYAIDFSLLCFNGHLLASSQGFTPRGNGSEVTVHTRRKVPDTKSHAPSLNQTTIAWQRSHWAEGKTKKNPGFILSAWIAGCLMIFSGGSSEGRTTGTRLTGKFKETGSGSNRRWNDLQN